MRDQLPLYAKSKECGVVNLDSSESSGTHWVCYHSIPNKKLYFDSYGLAPPLELSEYLNDDIEYNTFRFQGTQPICGHLCLFVLKRLSSGQDFMSILLELKLIFNYN